MAIETQGKDYNTNQHINLNKYRLLWTTLSNIRTAQMCTAVPIMDIDHMRILRVSASNSWVHVLGIYIYIYIFKLRTRITRIILCGLRITVSCRFLYSR